MFDQYDYQNYGTTTAAPKYTKENQLPMPSREELLARNSFPGPDNNRHLDRMPSREELLARNSFGSVNNNKHLDRMLGKTK